MEDTIAAISTAIGDGAIAIIRLSGPRALAIADVIFNGRQGRPSNFQSRVLHYGGFGALDRGMLVVMRAPQTYTGEDLVEFHCHGGLLTTRRVLALCLQHGARAAEPGEFTKRAFLNGKLDLTQAEGVMDLIRAKTDRAQIAAVHALEGHLSRRVNKLREGLISVLAHIEAHIDFPEEDIQPETRQQLLAQLNDIVADLEQLRRTASQGKILRDGITVAIVGRPNVGKSSLMNALLGEERSIVTPVPGTTRDTVEEFANIHGIPFRLIDTAGIREARGEVEKIGVHRSHQSLVESQLVLHVIDGSRKFSQQDKLIAAHYGSKPSVVIVSKQDLLQKLRLPDTWSRRTIKTLSMVNSVGLEGVRDAMVAAVFGGEIVEIADEATINDRHLDAVGRGLIKLTNARSHIKQAAHLEIISQELRMALDAIGEIVGKTSTEDILSKIFSVFCIGK